MGKDLIIGVVDNYDWDKIKYWANSIKKSGFEGHKALIVYNMNAETVKRLTEEEFMMIGCNEYDEKTGFYHDNSRGNVMVDRFFHISSFLSMLEEPINRVIITDVRDVVFQNNPSDWLDKHFLGNFDLVIGSENMTYGNEPWGANNITKAFGPLFFEKKKDDPIFCAGVIAGDMASIRDLCMNVWLICRGLNPHVDGGGGPDQAALNILLDFEPYRYSTLFCNPSAGWVLHAGTSLPAIQAGSGGIGAAYKINPNMSIDFMDELEYSVKDGKVYVFDKEVSVLHQWDRVPQWKSIVEEVYGV